MPELYLDLAEVRPFDILLTSEKTWQSIAINAIQTLDRRRRSKYSHAALFLAPSLLVESDAAITFRSVTHRWKDRLNSEPIMIFCRRNGVSTILVPLQNCRAATVLRVKDQSTGISFATIEKPLEAALYRQYDYSRIPAALGFLSPRIAALLTDIYRKFVRVTHAGPFCSEFVQTMMASIGLTFAKGRPLLPSDFCDDKQLTEIRSAVFVSSHDQDIEEIGPQQSTRFSSLLIPPLLWQAMPDVALAAFTIDKVERTLGANPRDLPDPSQSAKQLAQWHTEVIERWTSISERFWFYFKESRKCFDKCPSHKDSARAKREWRPRLRFPNTTNTLSPSTETRCRSANDCYVISPYYEEIDEQRSQLLKEICLASTQRFVDAKKASSSFPD
ncbi:hypothetical protein [Dongia rigui]|uniref:Uncharacterized protein n=1 Tax=Dongia rigui TaxID=940149 RepID=A0ABU5E408_9PROT|nr:hypothetical protein [Dongia rigui]MDY0874373.1 hypothetical protein [Dongia rigui]